MDAVLGYHLKPLTCGVAKFNLTLARRLSLPLLSVFDPAAARCARPLLSLKLSEFRPDDVEALRRLLGGAPWRDAFELFLHDWTATALERALLDGARTAYCANAEMTAAVRALRPDAVEAWCPSTVLEPRRFAPCDLSVFAFGMAHKVRTDHYGRLHALLQATGRPYCLYLSTALHEDTTLDGSFTAAFEELAAIFGPRVHFLGYLSDAAVHNYLLDTTFFAAFFDRGVRANNTTVGAAMQAGSVVVTNLDRYSPPAYVHGENLLDIARCDALPADPAVLRSLGEGARAVGPEVAPGYRKPERLKRGGVRDDEPAGEALGQARGQPLGRRAGAADLDEGESGVERRQAARDLALERRLVGAEHGIAEPAADLGLDRRDQPLRFRRGLALGRDPHVHLAEVRERADGRVAPRLHEVGDQLPDAALAQAHGLQDPQADLALDRVALAEPRQHAPRQ